MSVEVVAGALTRELRRRVLRPHLAPGDPLPGDELPDAVHFAALADGEPVSTCWVVRAPCPWMPGQTPSWQLRQMATQPDHRGRGLASAVVAAVLTYVGEHGGGLLWCSARERAVPMYARAGFGAVGEIFIEHQVAHRRMWRRVENLAASPSRLPDVGATGSPR